METNPTRMCELLVGLPAVTILGIDDVEDGPIRVHLERFESRTGCPACGGVAESKGRRLVELVDLPDPLILEAPAPTQVDLRPCSIPKCQQHSRR